MGFKEEGTFVVGQKIYSILYGGRSGVIFKIEGEQAPKTVGKIAGILSIGGRATFSIVFKNGTISPGLPECILRGVQWEVYEEVASAEEIKAMLEFAAQESERKEKEAAEALTAKEVLKVELLAKYPFLEQIGECAGKAKTNKNIRAWLKFNFPKQKFSVSSPYYGRTNVKCETLTTEEIQKCVGIFKAGSFNGMADSYDYDCTAFNELFGSVQYVFSYGKPREGYAPCGYEIGS